jgi:hypothetical protein
MLEKNNKPKINGKKLEQYLIMRNYIIEKNFFEKIPPKEPTKEDCDYVLELYNQLRQY